MVCVAPSNILLSNSADRPTEHLAARNRYCSTRLTHALYTRNPSDSQHLTVTSWVFALQPTTAPTVRTVPPGAHDGATTTSTHSPWLLKMHTCHIFASMGVNNIHIQVHERFISPLSRKLGGELQHGMQSVRGPLIQRICRPWPVILCFP